MDFEVENHDWFPVKSSITHLDFSDIQTHTDSISFAIKNHPVVILDSSDQSSKTYYIPSLLYTSGYSENGWRIGVVFPNRQAAKSKFPTIVELLSTSTTNINLDWFDSANSCRVYIQILTPETLLLEFRKSELLDSNSTGFSAIYFDSFPMSGIKGELCLSLLQRIIHKRPEFRLIIGTQFNDQVSELLTFFNGNDSEDFVGFSPLGNKIAVVMTLDKINKPNAKIKHLPVIPDDAVERSLLLAEEIHQTMPQGNILIFLPSSSDCKDAAEAIADQRIKDLVIVSREEVTVSSNELKRYLFFASDIYQIDRSYRGIRYVIDTGLKVIPEYNLENRNLYIMPSKINEHEAKLRAAIASEITYRLYPPGYFLKGQETGALMNLHEISLFLLALKIDDLKTFNFYRRPSLPMLSYHLLQLFQLGIINKNGVLTPGIGENIVSFCGLPLCFSRFLLASFEQGVVEAAITIIPLLSLNQKFYYGVSRVRQGDLLSAANFYHRYINFTEPEHKNNIANVKRMKYLLRQKCETIGKVSNGRQTENLLKAIVAGFFLNSAVFNVTRQVYIHLITNQQLYVHPDSVMRDLDMITHVHYVVFGSIEVLDKPYMKNITVIDDPQILVDAAPEVYTGILGRLPSSQRQRPVRILDDSILPSSLIGIAHTLNYHTARQKK